MSNRILNLIFKADGKQATAEMNKLTGKPGAEGLGGTGILGVSAAMKSVIVPALALSGAITAGGAVIAKEVGQWSDFITEVSHLKDMFGLTAEDAGVLYDAMARGEITMAQMEGILRSLVTNGLDPSIKSIQDLLAEYDSIPDELSKAEFALEQFGTLGLASLIPYYNSLDDAQKAYFLTMQDNLIPITDEVIQMNEELKASTLDATNEWRALKFELLEGVIPAWTAFLQLLTGKTAADALNFVNALGGGSSGLGVGVGQSFTGGSSPGGTFQYGGGARGFNPAQDPRSNRPGGNYQYATGGSFTVGGSGGSDSQSVGFNATPGETVTIGGGTNDMENVRFEIQRLVDILPDAIADAVERR